MKKIILFLLFLVSGGVFAQGNHSALWLYGKNVGYTFDDTVIEKEGIVGVANCYVRDIPSTSGKLIDSLQLGKSVVVKKLTEKTQKIKGIDMNWVEIQYMYDGLTKKGYLWLGFLALDFKTTENLVFLTALERVNVKKVDEDYTGSEYVLGIKVLDQNRVLLDSKEIRKNIIESHFHQQNLMGNYGLQNIQKIYRISFSGEACGIPTYYFYFGWTGKKLLVLPEKMSVSDAGVYYHSETFIFPNEPGGKAGHIFKVVEEAEEQESSNENESVMEEQVWKETYTWDGEKATFVRKNLLKKGLIKQ